MKLPSEPVLNRELSSQLGRPVLKMDVIGVRSGEELLLRFISQSGSWRQGVWVAVAGEITANGVTADQFELWSDTAPREVRLTVAKTGDGLLRLYNIWDSHRGRRRESQSATSGMLKEVRDSTARYSCNDIGLDPLFNKLVFELDQSR